MQEGISMAETQQGQGVSTEGESSVDMSNNSPVKRGRGRPQGSKKLKVCVTDVNLMELVSGISNGGSTQPQRGRGRPSTKNKVQEGADHGHAVKSVPTDWDKGISDVIKNKASNGNHSVTDQSPRKRGRPKKSPSKSPSEKVAAEDLPNGGSETPKTARGRPKGSTKRKSESLTSDDKAEGSSVPPRKRGRPKRSLSKKTSLETEDKSDYEAETDENVDSPRKEEVNTRKRLTQDKSIGIINSPRRGRGRPRKNIGQKSKDQQVTDDSQPAKAGRGRPKGSLNKEHPLNVYVLRGTLSKKVHVTLAKETRGRPRRQPGKRGRPRKYPPLAPEERKKPKIWKPLGRPRKYPRVDPPEGGPPPPHRRPGRPRKCESKRGAHLRKNFPDTESSPCNPSDGPHRKRDPPPSVPNSADITPRRRGRPRGSLNKKKASTDTELNSALRNHLKEKGVEHGGRLLKEEAERRTQTHPTGHVQDTEELRIKQEEVTNQA